MGKIIITDQEMSALNGLPFIQRLVYLQGVKPYVDYQTGIVGIKRGISYQSLAEVLYIEPHQGIQSGSPSKDQLRRALKGLEKSGLLECCSTDKKLIFKCLLLDQDEFAQKKPATKPHHQLASEDGENNIINSLSYSNFREQAAPPKNAKATIPLNSNNYICLLKHFEKFWALYPLKNSEPKAWQVFQGLNPTEGLMTQIISALDNQIQFVQRQRVLGRWVANWKNPANWLAQQCWKDVIPTEQQSQENQYAKNKISYRKQRAEDPLWNLCKPDRGESEDSCSNVIPISRGKH